MARPSKLTDKQWAELEKRHLNGESVKDLAAAYKIGIQTVRDRVIIRNGLVKEVAQQIVAVEQRFASLPVSVQVAARTLADELKAITTHLTGAARHGAMTAHRLAQIANAQTERIDEGGTFDDNAETLKSIAALGKCANEAAQIGMGLLQANKDTMSKLGEQANPNSIRQLTDAELIEIASGG